MVLTAYIVLSPVTGLVCHRHRRNCFRQLDASVGASGPHDFAVRKSALSSLAPPASTASRSNVRDDRETPLVRNGTARVIEVIWVCGEAEYFSKGDWTANSLICPSGNSIDFFRHCEPTGPAKWGGGLGGGWIGQLRSSSLSPSRRKLDGAGSSQNCWARQSTQAVAPTNAICKSWVTFAAFGRSL